MKENYLTRRKLVKLFNYIKKKGCKITVTDEHDCSFTGARWCENYTGVIKNFSVTSYEDAEIKLLIEFDTGSAEIWLANSYYVHTFKMFDYIRYLHGNGDGTYSEFIIEFK